MGEPHLKILFKSGKFQQITLGVDKLKIIKLMEESVLKALYRGRNQQTKEQGVKRTRKRIESPNTPPPPLPPLSPMKYAKDPVNWELFNELY